MADVNAVDTHDHAYPLGRPRVQRRLDRQRQQHDRTGGYHWACRRAADRLGGRVLILSYALADLSVKTAVRLGP